MGGQRSLFSDWIGTTFESKYWLSLDACGLPCVCVSYAIHLFALRTIASHLISHSRAAQCIWYLLYLPMSILALLNLFTAQTTDPGAVPLGARPLGVTRPRRNRGSGGGGSSSSNNDNGNNNTTKQDRRISDDRESISSAASGESLKSSSSSSVDQESLPLATATSPRNGGGSSTSRSASTSRHQRCEIAKSRAAQRGIMRCHKCGNNYKPARAHHDSVTGRCIVKFDHYCPWVGNAVGAMNHKFFVLFIFYTCLSSLLSILLLFMRFIRCASMTSIDEDGDDDGSNSATYTYPGCETIHSTPVILLTIVSVSFTFFTCCMLFEQWDAIESNQSKIAKLKVAMGRGGSELDRVANDVNELFGGTHPYPAWHWFLPTKVWFRSERKLEAILGYEFRQEWLGEVYREEDHDDLEHGLDVDNRVSDAFGVNGLQGINQVLASGEEEGNFVGGGMRTSSLMLPSSKGITKVTKPLEIDDGDVVTSAARDRSDAVKKRVSAANYDRQESDVSMKIV